MIAAENPIFSQNSMQRILVIRALPGLGDLLCAGPFVRSLRAAFPAAQIDILGLPQMRWFAPYLPISNWVDFPGFPGIPEGWQGVSALPEFLAQMHSRPYDLVLQVHGSGSYMNPFAVLLGAKHLAGFYQPGHYFPQPGVFLAYPQAEPEIWRLLRLLEGLGIPVADSELAFPVTARDRLQAQRLVQSRCARPARYICLHAGASTPLRRWSASGFAQVADALAARGYAVVLTGTPSEAAVGEAVQQQMRSPAVNLVGQTRLGELAALVQQAALLVCNDTGVSHLGAALKTPSVVIFSDSEVTRWAPLDRERHRAVDVRTVSNPLTAVLAAADALLREVAYVG